ncbi:MAG: hypothetical protein ACRDTC_01120 [Pseudonocardiaceae bacterium]
MVGRGALIQDPDWPLIRAEFEQRKISSLRRTLQDRGVNFSGLDDVLRMSSRVADVNGATEELTEFLLPVWNSLKSRPADCVLLSVFVYVRCQVAWEISADEKRIAAATRSLRSSWERVTKPADPSVRLAVEIVIAHAQSLLHCLHAENAVNCSCPVELASQAALVATESARLLARCAELSTEWAGFRDEFLVPVLRSHQLTYDSLRAAADSVTAWAEQGRAAEPALRRAIEMLERAERDPSVVSDVYASELRGHRAGLRALHARLGDPTVPDIRIEHAKIVYCYPFSIPGRDGGEICLRATQLVPECFGRGREFDVAAMQLSDLWNAQGRQKPLYGGITISLPELTVQTTSGEVLTGYAVSIRLSRLGNHYIRIEKPIRDYTLHELNQAMRRASPYMGLETVTEVGGTAGPWRRLTEYVEELATRLFQLVVPENASAGSVAPTVLATEADFHVLLEIASAIVTNDDGTARSATTGDVLAATGPLFRAPLEGLPSTLEEWARFGELPQDGSEPDSNLVDSTFAFPSDSVGRTLSSTFMVMLDTPNWTILGYEEHAEFVASLPPLLEGWRKELVKAMEAERGEELHLLGATELSQRRMMLQDHVRKIQDQIAALHSSDLWKSPSSRRFGESLYTASGLHDIELELTQTITRVELYYERLAALISQNEERRNRRYQTLVELILSLLAVASLAEVLNLVNQLFGLHGNTTAWWEVSVLAVAAVVVGLVVGVVYKLRD